MIKIEEIQFKNVVKPGYMKMLNFTEIEILARGDHKILTSRKRNPLNQNFMIETVRYNYD